MKSTRRWFENTMLAIVTFGGFLAVNIETAKGNNIIAC